MNNDKLTFRAFDNPRRTLNDCTLTVDKSGRFWLWSEQLQCNIAYKADTKEDALVAAISSLLFHIQLKDNRIKELQRIADLAEKFAGEIAPSQDNED